VETLPSIIRLQFLLDWEIKMSDKIFTLEDYLTRYHSGQWFTYSDVKNKSYETLICKNDETRWSDVVKPTKKQCEDGVKALQTKYDTQTFARNRALAFPSIGDQLDMLFHDMTAGKGTKDGEWYKTVAKVKEDNPKPDGWKE